MRAIRTLTILALCTSALTAQAYEQIEGQLTDSKIYPGTTHTFTVTLPDGYDGSEPAALYVGLDGILCDAPRVIDRLHAAGEIPAVIGVFLQPGVVYGADGEVLRYNRSNEFDATDSVFATFLERELLPAVEALSSASGKAVKLSHNPANRMIFGLSSGGIAAFTAAWHRPDLFGKVFTGCATLVPMRGGHNLQAIVRKHEPKPLKIVLQDTYHDTWNPLFGSWYEANVLMASALEFAGYDVTTDWTEGVHSVSRANEIFPEVMRRMWAPGTDTITAGKTANNFLHPLLVEGEGWTATEAPFVPGTGAGMRRAVWPDGTVAAYSEPQSNFLMQSLVDADGKEYAAQRYYWLHTYDNKMVPVGGMAFDGAGNLWCVTGAGLQICDQNGRVRAILELPRGLDVASTSIALTDGAAMLTDGKQTWRRPLNITAPAKGQRPKSQGPA